MNEKLRNDCARNERGDCSLSRVKRSEEEEKEKALRRSRERSEERERAKKFFLLLPIAVCMRVANSFIHSQTNFYSFATGTVCSASSSFLLLHFFLLLLLPSRSFEQLSKQLDILKADPARDRQLRLTLPLSCQCCCSLHLFL